jgi:hypothetical protein
MDKMRQVQTCDLGLTIGQKLRASVSSSVAHHWNDKIFLELVPTEVLLKAMRYGVPVDLVKHHAELQKIADFELQSAACVLEAMSRSRDLKFTTLHYIGIGLALAFKKIVLMANAKDVAVTGYDASTKGCDNGRAVIEEVEQETGLRINHVYKGDMGRVCHPDIIDPTTLSVIMASRTWDVVNVMRSRARTEERKRLEKRRKACRVARQIGGLLRFNASALLIHPCFEDNRDAVFCDTTPYPLELLIACVQRGLGAKLSVAVLGKVDFHGHLYTAVEFKKA